MYKAFGFITCVSVMAASLYVFSGGNPSQTLSAQTESDASGDAALARQFMKGARKHASQGNIKKARELAGAAAALNVAWRSNEQTPKQFIDSLNRTLDSVAWSVPEEIDWSSLDPEAENADGDLQTIMPEPQASASTDGRSIPNRGRAEKLMKEAIAALEADDVQLARVRAMQAKQLNVAWGLWEKKPEDILAAIDQTQGTTTFLAGDRNAPAAATTGTGRQQADQLLKQARAAMDADNLTLAAKLADQAEALGRTYGPFDDTPALVRRDIERFTGAVQRIEFDAQQPSAADFSPTFETSEGESFDFGATELAHTFDDQQDEEACQLIPRSAETDLAEPVETEMALKPLTDHSIPAASVTPVPVTPPVEVPAVDVVSFEQQNSSEMSAEDAWQLGMSHLRSGDHLAARDAFLEAKKNIGELDSYRRQQLNDQLQELATIRDNRVRPVSVMRDEIEQVSDEIDPLAAAADKHNAQLQRMRRDVTNSVARAQDLKDKDVEEGLLILDQTLAAIEESQLTEESVRSLTSYVKKNRAELEDWRESRAPIIEMQERNDAIEKAIQRELEIEIRIEQEFAELVDEYNRLNDERRYAEAAVVAQKAYDLNPTLPQATLMLSKSKLQKQIAFNDDARERQADGNLAMFNEIETSFAGPRDTEFHPDVPSWLGLSRRREGYGLSGGRNLTESELQIQKSLREQVSLHFNDVALTDIIQHIATEHGINIVIDKKALETHGLQPEQSVSINVDGIQLRSALNLLLKQSGGLVYSVEDEVLTITDSLQQETFTPKAYPVADLVVPLSAVPKASAFGSVSSDSNGSNGLYQINDDLGVQIGPGGLPRSGSQTSSQREGEVDFTALIEMLQTTVAPGSWDIDGGAGTVHHNENTLSLVIRQTPAVHDEIVELLEQLRKLQDLQVTVEVRFIAVSDDFFERIGVDFDFNVPDSLGDPVGVPAFGSTNFQLPGGAGGAAGQGGGQGGGAAGAAGVGGIGGATGAAGGAAGAAGGLAGGQAGGQAGQQGQIGGGQFGLLPSTFTTVPRNNFTQDGFRRTTVGLQAPGTFTDDFDIQFQQGSFELGVPQFGNFDPTGGLSVGMAILSDLEAFFFLEAVQSDRRANVMFAPKVTLFNGQQATLTDTVQQPYVASLSPVVGTGAVGFQPQIGFINSGITLNVNAVISADRRYVRLSLAPNFNNLVDIFTYTFASGGAGGAGIGGAGGGGIGGGGIGGAGGIGGVGGIGGFGGGGQAGGQGGGGFGGGGFGGGGQGGGGLGGQAGGAQAGAGDLTIQQPIIENISVSTTVSVPDGGTVLLGGVKRLREGRTMYGVPILNKIPYVSRLFKNSGVGRETESVMLMVTPRIIIQEEEEELILGQSGQYD